MGVSGPPKVKQVMKKIAENGGKLPDDLKD
jgi:hypothetical protein